MSQSGVDPLYRTGLTTLPPVDTGHNDANDTSSETASDAGSNAGTKIFTPEDALESVGFGRWQYMLLFLTGLLWCADAMEILLLSFISPVVACEWKLSPFEESLISSVVFLGMLVGAPFWGIVSDKIGRRKAYAAGSIFTAVFSLASAMSPNLTVLLLTRGLVGFGVTSSVVAFSLFTEFLPLLQRGRYLLLIELFWTAGTVLEVGLAWMILPSIGWRWLLFISAIPIVLGAALSKLIPESPRYLLVAGQPEKALSVFRRAADANKSTLPEGSLLKRPPSTNRGSIKAFFTRDMMRMLVPLFLVWFANAFLYYGLILFTSIAIASDGSGSEQEASPTDSSCQLSNSMYLSILITTLSEVPGLLISVWLLDRVGRKKTMAGGLSVTSVCFFLVLIPLGAVGKTFVLSVGRAAIYGAFCVVYVYTPEVFPTTIRSLGLGACSSFARFGGILSPIIANGVLSNSLWLPVALYGSCAFCASVAAMLLPVETTGVALREETLVVDVLPSRENSSKQELDQEALLAESV